MIVLVLNEVSWVTKEMHKHLLVDLAAVVLSWMTEMSTDRMN
mgnify:CR=1 FL=1